MGGTIILTFERISLALEDNMIESDIAAHSNEFRRKEWRGQEMGIEF